MELFSHTGHISRAEEPHVANGRPLDGTEHSGIRGSSTGQHRFILLVYALVLFSQNSKRLYFLGCSTDSSLDVSAPDCIRRMQVTLLIPASSVITVVWSTQRHFHCPQEDCIMIIF